MQFEKLPDDSEYEIKISFDDTEEAEIVRAVYREHIVELAKNGNIGSISSHDQFMSDYGLDDEYPFVEFSSTARLMQRLRHFHERTDEAVTDLAHATDVPSYDNFYIKERLELGRSALDLSETISEEAIIGDAVRKLDTPSELDPRINP